MTEFPRHHCQGCKENTVFVNDGKTGDLICGRCGTILLTRTLDVGNEWRSFADDEPNNGAARASDFDFLFGSSMTVFVGGSYLSEFFFQYLFIFT